MAAIPPDTYRDWARRLNVLERRWFGLMPWTNLHPNSSAMRKGWRAFASRASAGFLDDVRDDLDNLAHVQHRLTITACGELLLFCGPRESGAPDEFETYWRSRASDIEKLQGASRCYPRPELLEGERLRLRRDLFEPADLLLREMTEGVAATLDSPRKAIALRTLGKASLRLARAQRMFSLG